MLASQRIGGGRQGLVVVFVQLITALQRKVRGPV